MPYCLFDKNTKEYLGGQLHSIPEPYDPENHVFLILEEYPTTNCKLNDDLVSYREPTNQENQAFDDSQKEILYGQLCKGQTFKFIIALAEIVYEVSNGKSFNNLDELIVELKKKSKWL